MTTSATFSLRRAIGATLFALPLLALSWSTADAAPATDERGFLDSTARCAAPSVAVAFGATATSRVAVCRAADGSYEYRGVRVSDGAKLIAAATASGTHGFVAEREGISYTVTPTALSVSSGEKVIRDEPWELYRGPAPTQSSSVPTTSAVPLPPPLPAEVGGGS